MKRKSILMGAGASLLAALPAAAQSPGYYYPTNRGAPIPQVYYAPYPPGNRELNAQEWTQYENGYSGTLGRQGLGADPRHPEGPGNASSPR